ncbi:MAG: hypothetical protein WD060_05545 [Pirellulales bacterium]
MKSVLLFFLVAIAFLGLANPSAASDDWTIRDGKLYVDGSWVFLKIGRPLRNFADPAACQKLTETLDTLQAKGFNALELNCYWHHFDKGMFPCLSVETYGVGGGQIP